MLNKPVDAIKNMLGGGSSGNDATNGSANNGAEGMNANSNTKNTLNNAENSTIDPAQVAGMRVKIRKTKKKRFRIGKHDDVVGVLLKNKQTQRHIQSEHLSLKQKTIGEIRKYLYDHHLLKIGSNAPPDVLRRMYEDAILTGDVKNTNKDVLLHNFMSGSGGE
jgi:Trm5-related predicted tRNA methylase